MPSFFFLIPQKIEKQEREIWSLTPPPSKLPTNAPLRHSNKIALFLLFLASQPALHSETALAATTEPSISTTEEDEESRALQLPVQGTSLRLSNKTDLWETQSETSRDSNLWVRIGKRRRKESWRICKSFWKKKKETKGFSFSRYEEPADVNISCGCCYMICSLSIYLCNSSNDNNKHTYLNNLDYIHHDKCVSTHCVLFTRSIIIWLNTRY